MMTRAQKRIMEEIEEKGYAIRHNGHCLKSLKILLDSKDVIFYSFNNVYIAFSFSTDREERLVILRDIMKNIKIVSKCLKWEYQENHLKTVCASQIAKIEEALETVGKLPKEEQPTKPELFLNNAEFALFSRFKGIDSILKIPENASEETVNFFRSTAKGLIAKGLAYVRCEADIDGDLKYVELSECVLTSRKYDITNVESQLPTSENNSATVPYWILVFEDYFPDQFKIIGAAGLSWTIKQDWASECVIAFLLDDLEVGQIYLNYTGKWGMCGDNWSHASYESDRNALVAYLMRRLAGNIKAGVTGE